MIGQQYTTISQSETSTCQAILLYHDMISLSSNCATAVRYIFVYSTWKKEKEFVGTKLHVLIEKPLWRSQYISIDTQIKYLHITPHS